MQNYITSFSALKSSQIVNDRLSWDEGSPHRHDCHDPPHEARGGFVDDRSPPRRLPAVARSDPWKVTRAQVGFPGDATRRRRLSRVAGSYRWNTGTGGDCLLRDRRGDDCYPGWEFDALAALPAAKIELECFAFAFLPKGCFGSRRASYAGLIELMGNRYGSTTYLGKSKGQQSAVSNLNFCFRAKTRERMCVCQRPSQSFNFLRF
jgi:hypothetical protein